MKTAIIGTGNIAHTHARATVSLGQPISLVVGHTKAGAEAFGRQYGCTVCADHLTPDLLAGIDCVQICTPPHLHYEAAERCLKLGKHVLCEKPLSLSPTKALSLQALADSRGVLASVVFNNRFYESVGRVRDIVSAPEFGAPFFIQGHYFQEFHILPATYSWRYDTRSGENLRAVTEIGSHFIDLMRYLSGREVERVSASFRTAWPERYLRNGMMLPEGVPEEKIRVDSEDVAAVTFELEGGVLAAAVYSEISPGRSNDLAIELTSLSSSVSWRSEAPYDVVTGQCGGGMTTKTMAFGGGFPDSFTAYFQEAYAVMESGEKSSRLPTFRDGARNAVICDGIGRSAAEDGRWIDVREGTK